MRFEQVPTVVATEGVAMMSSILTPGSVARFVIL